MLSKINVGLVGATGAVGREVLRILEQRHFPLASLKIFSSSKSAGRPIPFHGAEIFAEELKEDESFKGLDLVFFATSSSVSEKYAWKAAQTGAFVIDNSSCFRMDPHVPLVVPEVNGEALERAKETRLIANPNCTTAQMVVVLKPLHDHFNIKRIVLSSYQAVSGKGQKGINELNNQIQDYVLKKSSKVEAFPHPIAFNCIPHIDTFWEDGFTGEEHKVIEETKKILGNNSIRIAATCVRVPVFNGHSESVSIETEKPISPQQAREVLNQIPGIKVIDEPRNNRYPLAQLASGKDEVFVGRMRQDPSFLPSENGLLLWIVADNLRKGAALNAVQIAENLLDRGILKPGAPLDGKT